MNVDMPNPEQLRDIINTSKEPIIFCNILNWNILNWNLADWNRELGEEELHARCGKNLRTIEPQWERTTKNITCKFEGFLNDNVGKDEWLYFDYKYLNENLFGCPGLKESISWESFGFPELTYKDSTIWIGSKGAHTPCHIDTYGCNLIAQVYGRKEWFICPPEENLHPTRIPYEESSIYSKINFFSPNIREVQSINSARKVTLNPGEVLFLPHGWWHYVENLETAISVNAWIPQPQDNEKRVEEAIARMVVSQIVKDLPPILRNNILNPNMESECTGKIDLSESLTVIEQCIQAAAKNNKRLCTKVKVGKNITTVSESITSTQYIKILPKLSREDIYKWAEKQNSRFNNVPLILSENNPNLLAGKIIDALLQPEILEIVKNKLL